MPGLRGMACGNRRWCGMLGDKGNGAGIGAVWNAGIREWRAGIGAVWNAGIRGMACGNRSGVEMLGDKGNGVWE